MSEEHTNTGTILHHEGSEMIKPHITEKSFDDWKSIGINAISYIVFMLIFWLAQGRNFVDRAEVSEMIKNESAYAIDRQFIMTSIADSKSTNEMVVKSLGELKIELVKLNAALDNMKRGGVGRIGQPFGDVAPN